MRTIIELTNEQIRELDRLRKLQQVSRTALVRQAVDAYLVTEREHQAPAAFGIWREQPRDALAHQETLRQEWSQ